MEFYASCPEGFESALADELKRLGLSHVRRLKGRATFEGELEEGYRACLWSRLASRVFVVLGRFEAQDADELYDSVYDIAWETIIRPGATIAITARGVTEQLRNTRFSALRAKDALCDRLAETTGRRADVDAADPDVHLLLSLRQRRASISLDLSGDPLFKRLPPAATRAGEGSHVLRPDYAALVLSQVGWTTLCERELTAVDYENEALPTLVDASCAGGGLLERRPDFDGCLLVVGHDGDRALGLGVERAGQQSVAGERGDRRRSELGRAVQLADERHGVVHKRQRCLGRIRDHGGTGDGARVVQYGRGLSGAKIDKALVAGALDHALSGFAGGGVNIHGHDACLPLACCRLALACLGKQLLPQGGVVQLPALKAPALAGGTRGAVG